jgi:hypothetical protein
MFTTLRPPKPRRVQLKCPKGNFQKLRCAHHSLSYKTKDSMISEASALTQFALERWAQWSHDKPHDNAIDRSTYRRLRTPLHPHGSRVDGILALDLF